MPAQIHIQMNELPRFHQDTGEPPRRQQFNLRAATDRFVRKWAKACVLLRPLLLLLLISSLSPSAVACGDNCVCFAEYISCEGLSVDELPSFENYRSVEVRGLYSDGLFQCAHLIGVKPDQWWEIETLYDELCPLVVECLEEWGAQVISASSSPMLASTVQSTRAPPSSTEQASTRQTAPNNSTISAGASDTTIISIASVVSVGVLMLVGFLLYKVVHHLRDTHHRHRDTGGQARFNRDVEDGQVELTTVPRHEPPFFFRNPLYDERENSLQGATESGKMEEPSTELATERDAPATVPPAPTDTARQQPAPLSQSPVLTDEAGAQSIKQELVADQESNLQGATATGVDTDVKRTINGSSPQTSINDSPQTSATDRTIKAEEDFQTPENRSNTRLPARSPLAHSTPLRDSPTASGSQHQSELDALVNSMLSPAREESTQQGVTDQAKKSAKTPRSGTSSRSPIRTRALAAKNPKKV